MNLIRVSDIVRVQVLEPEVDTDYRYLKAVKVLGITLKKEGLYQRSVLGGWHGPIDPAELHHRYVLDDKVYCFPRLVIERKEATSYYFSRNLATVETMAEGIKNALGTSKPNDFIDIDKYAQ